MLAMWEEQGCCPVSLEKCWLFYPMTSSLPLQNKYQAMKLSNCITLQLINTK